MIAKLLVANRGEIAARVLRTARAMGIATVAVFSEPDRDAPFVALADEAVPLGGAAPADSYLRAEAVLDAAERTGADAVHPGYGFLSERPDFAEGCRKRGLRFVGPPPEVLAALGDKLEAKRVATGAGVPVLPSLAVAGRPGPALAAAADAEVGFPLLVKAAHGGGGIGMRVVRAPADLPAAVETARRQAAGAFGDDAVFLEPWLDAPRHVEVQILADTSGRMVQLFERECSIQRRHQKLVEEAPSPAVDPGLRDRLGNAALSVARAVGYVGAGTVEFLLERSGDAFWFLEVNPRIQVEHPVTEAITGLDLVRLQLLLAVGDPLPPEALKVQARGHAIEARLYAEDPASDFLPQAGTLHRFRLGPEAAGVGVGVVGSGDGAGPQPSGPAAAPGPPSGGWGVRVDAGVADGSVVGVHYDPLLAKVVAHAPTRPEAARMLTATLAAARLHGIVTNRDLLVGVLRSEPFLSGATDTAFLDRHPPAELVAAGGSSDPSTLRLHAAAATLAAQAARRAAATVYPAVPSGWRNNPSQLQRVTLEPGPRPGSAAVPVAYRFDRTGTLEALEIDGDPLPAPRLWRCTPDLVDLETDGIRRRYEVHRLGRATYVDSSLGHSEFREPAAPAAAGDPGLWTAAPAAVGDPAASAAARDPGLWTAAPAAAGAGLGSPTGGPGTGPGGSGAAGSGDGTGGPLTGERMVSPLPGVVRRVAVRVGDPVEVGAVLVVVEAMKTEHRVAAARAGRVRRVLVAEGQEVAAGAVVVELEEAGDG